MVEYTNRDNATRFITPDTPNEWIMLPGVAVYVNEHQPGETAELHTHDQDHVLVMRSGRMRWTVEGETFDAGAGDVVIAPSGVEHAFEVLGHEPVRLLCVESPNPEPEQLGPGAGGRAPSP